MNKIIIIGNLGKIPELKTTKSNAKFCNFTVAVNRVIKGDKLTQWFNVTCWNKTAEYASKHLAKGSKVAVEGRMESYETIDKGSGSKGLFWGITASAIFGLGTSQREPEHSSDVDMVDKNVSGNVKPPEIDLHDYASDDVPF